MDTTKWKSVAIRLDVYEKYKKYCKKEKRSPSDQLEILISEAIAAKRAEKKEIAELKAASSNDRVVL
jgi:predicted CopG family antitoxin